MEQSKKQVWFVYAGENGEYQVYFVLDSLDANNGKRLEAEEPFYTDKKLFKGGVGAINEAALIGDKVSYKKGALPVGFWKNAGDLAAWRARDAASKAIAHIEAQTKNDHLAKYLEPLRRQYDACRNRTQRTALLAEVMRIITSC